jgi:ribosomal protein S18 acetylase RimI-like enzyme
MYMSKLVPMTQAEYDVYIERLITDYAQDNVRAGYWSEDEALERSRQQTVSLLPQGLQTKNHYLYTMFDGDMAVGIIWLRAELDRPVKVGFLFDVEIHQEFRGRGYGREIMSLIEEKARKLDIKKLALHVFGYNDVARKLYESAGYEISSLNMIKALK